MSAEAKGGRHLYGAKCRMIGCEFEAAGNHRFTARALEEHLTTAHGIGAVRKVDEIGCPFRSCSYSVKGSRAYVQTVMADHLMHKHGVNPEDPETLPTRRQG